MKPRVSVVGAIVVAGASLLHGAGRPLRVDDIFALKEVGDPQLSADGALVAYTVQTLDAKEDASRTDIYMAPLTGGEPQRLTVGKKSATAPRFSPDGKWLAFLSSREGDHAQVYLLPLRGGEAEKLTDFKADVAEVAFSPSGDRIALVVSDVDPDAPAATEGDDASKKTPKPIATRRRQFKRDGEGYLREIRTHVHIFDLKSRSAFQLTSGAYDDSEIAWSPDGRSVAFSSNRTSDPDSNQNSDIFVVDAYPGAKPRAAASTLGEDHHPTFSPDGRWIAYIAGGDPKDMWYGANHVAIVPAAGGEPRGLTQSLDRNVFGLDFAPDSRSVLFLVEDGGNQHVRRVGVDGGAIENVLSGEREIQAFDVGPKGEIVFLESRPNLPAEVSALVSGEERRVTHVNDEALRGVALGTVERFKAKSKDGTMVDGYLTLPPGYVRGSKLPGILRIHGGPTSQYSTGFEIEWQMLAAQGYAVIGCNPRGSTGRGTTFSRAIWADWGNKDFEDVMAAVDHVVGMGIADPERLGVGGWSYGGILTDYVVTKTTRFKAATSGASMANMLAGYGTDHYQYWWETELGLPWRNRDQWLKISSSFFDVEKIATPILYLGGQIDMNVPVLATEQLYQAVKRLGKVDTELVVYPEQWHGIRKPSYQKDRFERYIAWYDKYLKPAKAAEAASKPEATSLLGQPLVFPEIPADTKKGLDENLTKAMADFAKNPDDADNIIWLGRRLGYLGRFREAIAVFTRGIAKFPEDVRMYRHRGHRHITVRELDKAVVDLTRAADLIARKKIPDAIEPDGAPNPKNVPTSTSHFNVFYHLGLAHFLKGDFASSERAYRECMKYSKHPDSLVATSDWLYMTLRRLGRKDDAAKVLEPIRADLDVIESTQYRDRLLMYKGEKKADDLLAAGGDAVGIATYGFGVGNFYLVNGETEKARDVFRRVIAGPQWAAFGYIASEADLARAAK